MPNKTPAGKGVPKDGRCVPDPNACGTDDYGDSGLVDGKNTLFVHADKGKDTNPGTRAKPFASIGQALSKIPSGGTVAVAAGSYSGPLALKKPVTLRGRCAAKVSVSAPAGQHVIIADANVTVRGLRLTGASKGLVLRGKTGATAHDLWITGLGLAGVLATNDSGTIQLDRIVTHNTKPDGKGVGGAGLAFSAADLAMNDIAVSHATGTGISLTDVTIGKAARVAVDATRPAIEVAGHGTGIDVTGGSELDLEDARIADNHQFGMRVMEATSAIRAKRVVVLRTRESPAVKSGGSGVTALKGGNAVLTDCRVSGSAVRGVSADGSGSAIVAKRLLVDGTHTGSQNVLGVGIVIERGATMLLEDSRVSDNRSAGIVLFNQGTYAQVRRVLVDRVRPVLDSVDGKHVGFAYGLMVGSGAFIQLYDARCTDYTGVGITLYNGARAQAERVLLDRPAMDSGKKAVNSGVACWNEPHHTTPMVAQFADLRIARPFGAGMFVMGPGVQVSVRGALVHGGRPDLGDNGRAASSQGVGVVVSGGATFRAAGAALVRNRVVGLLAGNPSVAGENTAYDSLVSVDVTGLLVADTRRDDKGAFGEGIWCEEAAQGCRITASRVVRNHSAGIYMASPGSSITSTVVANTLAGFMARDRSESKIADGIIARLTDVAIRESIVTGSERSGITAADKAKATIVATAVTKAAAGLATTTGGEAKAERVLLHDNTANRSTVKLVLPTPPKIVAPASFGVDQP